MKPHQKISAFAISITTSILFIPWVFIKNLLIEKPDWFINPDNQKYNIIGVILLGFISIGVYRILLTFVEFMMRSSNYVKKWILSSYYMEGTWIGFYIGVSGNVRYIIETYEQTLDDLVIKGMSFDETKNLHTFWTSESYNIDANTGEINYQYKVRSTHEKTDPNGIAYFNFIRDNNKKSPEFIVGYSADSHMTKKCRAVEKKLSKSTRYDVKKALGEAVLFYEEYKDYVFDNKKKVS